MPLLTLVLAVFMVLVSLWRITEVRSTRDEMALQIENHFNDWTINYFIEIECLIQIFFDQETAGEDYEEYFVSTQDERNRFWRELSLLPELFQGVLFLEHSDPDAAFYYDYAGRTVRKSAVDAFLKYFDYVSETGLPESIYGGYYPLYIPEKALDIPFIIKYGESWDCIFFLSHNALISSLPNAVSSYSAPADKALRRSYSIRIMTGGQELTQKLSKDPDLIAFSLTHLYSSRPQTTLKERTRKLPESLAEKDDLRMALSYRSRALAERLEYQYGTEDDATEFQVAGTGVWAVMEIDQHRLLLHAIRVQLGQMLLAYTALALLIVLVFTLYRYNLRNSRLVRDQMSFIASVSHELRTPLAVICNAGDNMERGFVVGDDRLRIYGKTIAGEGRRLSRMVESILLYSGMLAGRDKKELLELDGVLSAVVRTAEFLCEQKGIEMKSSIEKELFIYADREGIESAVSNLLNNAVLHGGSGGIVEFEVKKEQGFIVFAVKDRGPGIKDSERKRLLMPFFRGSKALDLAVPGSGLGLSLVSRVAELHGGSLRYENRKDGGAEFRLILPVEEVCTE